MESTALAARRGLYAVFTAFAVGGAVVVGLTMPSAPSATAATDPCAASEVAKTVGSVATSMGTYLDAHPQTNQALTTISQQQGGPQSLVAMKTYFDANPQVGKDIQQLQQPLVNLSGRCKLPLTLPQIMGLMQAAQQASGVSSLPSGLPTTLPGAQAVGAPSAAAAAQSSTATSVPQGAGRLPGPAIAGLP